MNSTFRTCVATLLLSVTCAGAVQSAGSSSPDAAAIEELVRNGGDVSKLHSVEFTLRFGTQKAAERAESRLLELAFSTRVEKVATEETWLVRGSKRMYPVESDLAGLRDKLDVIATEGRGRYEGWRAKLVVPGG